MRARVCTWLDQLGMSRNLRASQQRDMVIVAGTGFDSPLGGERYSGYEAGWLVSCWARVLVLWLVMMTTMAMAMGARIFESEVSTEARGMDRVVHGATCTMVET